MMNEKEKLLKEIPTCDLVTELRTREGVITHVVAPYELYSINQESLRAYGAESKGPAIILEVID